MLIISVSIFTVSTTTQKFESIYFLYKARDEITLNGIK